MRELKFRAISNGKLYECHACNFETMNALVEVGFSSPQWCKVERFIQYTGYKDKHGREIYDGDTIKHTRFNWSPEGNSKHKTNLTLTATVFWDEECCAFRADGKFESGGGFGWGFPLDNDARAERTEVEILGSIYENPELLKEGK